MPSICFMSHMTISEESQPQRKEDYLAHSKARVVVRDTPALSSYGGYQRLEWCKKKGHRVLQKSTETGIPSSFPITYSSDPRSPARTHFLNIASLGTKLPIEKQRKKKHTNVQRVYHPKVLSMYPRNIQKYLETPFAIGKN